MTGLGSLSKGGIGSALGRQGGRKEKSTRDLFRPEISRTSMTDFGRVGASRYGCGVGIGTLKFESGWGFGEHCLELLYRVTQKYTAKPPKIGRQFCNGLGAF